MLEWELTKRSFGTVCLRDQLLAVLNFPQLRLELLYHFLEGPCGLVLFRQLVFLRSRSSGPMLVELGHPTLQEGAQEGRSSGISNIPDETEMQKARNGLLKSVHP
jgi:hypothetical protein